jgi:putative membrane protein insertion efficiency factor
LITLRRAATIPPVKKEQEQRDGSSWLNGMPSCDFNCGDGCDGCGGCNFMLGTLLLGTMAVSTPRRKPRSTASGPGRAGMAAIRGYQRWLSPHLPTRCRQIPTCSNYGLEAVRRYGLVTGSRLTAARIRRCNPSTPRGTHDQVP